MRLEIQKTWQIASIIAPIVLYSIGGLYYMTVSYFQGQTNQALQVKQTQMIGEKIDKLNSHLEKAVDRIGNHETRISILESKDN